MTPFLAFLQQQTGTAWRSSALHPLLWLLVVLGGIALALCAAGQRTLAIVVTVLLGVDVLLIMVMFCVFAVKNPDLLRSERYNIHKAALQYMGDSSSGLMPPEGILRAIGISEGEDGEA